jgi:UPF0176 protein
MEGCCSTTCINVIHLPKKSKKAIRRGIKRQYDFQKRKSDVLTFKTIKKVTEHLWRGSKKPIIKEVKEKQYIGKEPTFSKTKCNFLIEETNLN